MAGKTKQRVTLNKVTQAVRALGYRDVELVRGCGYYYWSGGVSNRFFEQGVYGVRNLNDLTLEAWVRDFKQRVSQARREGRLPEMIKR